MTFPNRILPLALLALPACEPNNLYVAHDTVVGLNARVNEGRQQGQLVFGFDRDFATVIPKSVELDNGDADVMALLNCTHLEVDGIYLDRYSDLTATGDAAINLSGTNASEAWVQQCTRKNLK